MSSDHLDLVSEVLEKMIEISIVQSSALTSLKQTTEDIKKETDQINRHFTNGFKSEIKKHVDVAFYELKSREIAVLTQKADKQEKAILQIQSDLNSKLSVDSLAIMDEIKSFKKLGFWFKILAGALVAIAGITIASAKISESLSDSKIGQKQNQELKQMIIDMQKDINDQGEER